jgi:uncharacterized protein YdeI (BOF family)
MKTPMKTLIVACLFATLLATSTAYAFEWPSAPQQPKGTEGPDTRHAAIQTVRGAEGPDAR